MEDRGTIALGGRLDSEKHYGGHGDDSIGDYTSKKTNPDVIRCGPGYDRADYNPGVDKVAADCEELHPVEW